MSRIEQLSQKLSPLMEKVIYHPLYNDISSITHLRIFMNVHVFAVWDFMCLLKELHRKIVSITAPWFPPKDALSANLISSILVEEEGDITEDGISYASHFEIYITAMEKIGADSIPIRTLLSLLKKGHRLDEAITMININAGAKNFVLTTFSFFELSLHELAAVFVYGREGITAGMFTPMLTQLEEKIEPSQRQMLSTLIYYFKRHISLDNNEHFPKALRMLENFIGQDNNKLAQAEKAAILALNARIEFLTNIHQQIQGAGH